MKRLIAMLLALMLLCGAAGAEVFEGSTVSYRSTPVQTAAGGVLNGLTAVVGQTVTAGETLAATKITRVYATQDGTVTRVEAKAGLDNSGLAISLAPVSRYLVYCTIDGSYDSLENKWIQLGEEVLVRCTRNGTHLGRGRVISISGNEYNVELLGGEMFVGETVYVHREDLYSYEKRVGKGTVVSADNEEYNVTGTVLSVNVAVGDEVSRGQLLMTYAADAATQVTSPVSGVITAMTHKNGDKLNADEAVLEVTAYSDILLCLTMSDEDASRLSVGDTATYTLACDRFEEEHTAAVTEISSLASDGSRKVYLTPDEPETLVGATVTVSVALH